MYLSTNYIIGLVVIDGDDRNLKGLQNLMDVWKRSPNIVWLLLAIGFVAFHHLVAKGRPGRVESYCQVSRLLVFHQIPKGSGKASNGRSIEPLRVDQRAINKGKVRTIYQSVAIE